MGSHGCPRVTESHYALADCYKKGKLLFLSAWYKKAFLLRHGYGYILKSRGKVRKAQQFFTTDGKITSLPAGFRMLIFFWSVLI